MTKPGNTLAPDWVGDLHEGERILWQGRPSGRVLPPTAFGFPYVFGCVVLAMAVTRLHSFLPNLYDGKFADEIHLLIASAIVAVVVYCSLILTDVFWRHHTRYALSNFRAFIEILAFGRRRLDVYPITSFSPLHLDETYAGGTVWFADKRTYDREESLEPWQAPLAIGGVVYRRIGFVGISDYRDVFAQMRQIQSGAT